MTETNIGGAKSKETKPQKTVRGTIVILGIVCILLIGSLGGAIGYYTKAINDKENQIDSANSAIASLDANISNLTSQIRNKNAQISNLQSQSALLDKPNIMEFDLYSNDNRPPSGTPYLHVYGFVYNTGIDTGYNCGLQVWAYQDIGGFKTLAMNSNISIGTINGLSSALVNASLPYNGSSLISWDIIAFPTTIPMA
jgi:hypothetical protein